MKYFVPYLFLFVCALPSITWAQVDYDSQIQPIFNSNCVGCHGGTSGVSLANYTQVMNSVGNLYGTAIVVPNEPNESPLVDKIEPNPDFGSRMPQGGALSEDQISLIRTWIAEGANEVATSNELITDVPTSFELEGNYPNPFNPSTVIHFSSPSAGNVTLTVYSISGQVVSERSVAVRAGSSSISINLQGNPSGLYLYRAQFAGMNGMMTTSIKKMTLIK